VLLEFLEAVRPRFSPLSMKTGTNAKGIKAI
jgi:hypothetical protein